MKVPSIKKGMSTFVGCDIGERRLGLLKSCFESNTVIQDLLKQKMLSATVEGNRVWLALTAKGKRHVEPREKYWSQL